MPARTRTIISGGWWLTTHGANAQSFFVLAAASMVLLGTLSCASVIMTRWGPRRAISAQVAPVLSEAAE